MMMQKIQGNNETCCKYQENIDWNDELPVIDSTIVQNVSSLILK